MSPKSNVLLANLPDTEYESLTSCMQLVSLPKGQTLFRAGDTLTHVYFPVGAIVSMMNDLPDGYSVETFMLGKTCMVGVAATDAPSFYRATVRSAGLAYRMRLSDLHRLRPQCPMYMRTAFEAVRQLIAHQSLSMACAKRHSLEQQIIRWLLITLDRSTGDTIDITHQELAEIVGFRREAITLTFGRLSELACLRTARGQIEVMDRSRLESFCCDCYWLAQQ